MVLLKQTLQLKDCSIFYNFFFGFFFFFFSKKKEDFSMFSQTFQLLPFTLSKKYSSLFLIMQNLFTNFHYFYGNFFKINFIHFFFFVYYKRLFIFFQKSFFLQQRLAKSFFFKRASGLGSHNYSVGAFIKTL